MNQQSLRSGEIDMNIFVGNMNREITKEDLENKFKKFGDVETVTILIDRINGEWKAFGFVEMPKREDAFKAIAELDGQDFRGKELVVHEARYRTEDRRSPSRMGGRRHTDIPDEDFPEK